MRKLCIVLFMIPLAALIGCSGSGTPGGSGRHSTAGSHNAANPSDTGSKHVLPGKTEPGKFTLSVPGGLTNTHIKQGESKTIKIGASKGENFQEDVTLKFEGLPKGVTVEGTPVIKASDKDVQVTLKAAPDAAVGDHEVTVWGEVKGAEPAKNSFKLTVDKK
jgi:hypothetical protein